MNKKQSVAVGILLNAMLVSSASADDMAHASVEGMAANEHEAAYLAENETAMAKMMADMEVKPTGDVDCDFVAIMTPHHQGAIAMAMAVVRHGRDEKIRHIAQKS